MDGFLNNPLSALGFGLLAKGQFGPGLLTGLDIYNNQRVAAQQNQLNQLKLQEAQRQAWLRNMQMKAMGRPASLPMTNPVLNNGTMFPGLQFYSNEALKSSKEQPADSVTAMYQAMDPGTGMFSADPNEQRSALQQYAMYSPDAISSLKSLAPSSPKETTKWREYQKAREEGYNKGFVQYQIDTRPSALTIATPDNPSPTSLKTTTAIIKSNPVTRSHFDKLSFTGQDYAAAVIDAEVSAKQAEDKTMKRPVRSTTTIIEELMKDPNSNTFKALTEKKNEGWSLSGWWSGLMNPPESESGTE